MLCSQSHAKVETKGENTSVVVIFLQKTAGEWEVLATYAYDKWLRRETIKANESR